MHKMRLMRVGILVSVFVTIFTYATFTEFRGKKNDFGGNDVSGVESSNDSSEKQCPFRHNEEKTCPSPASKVSRQQGLNALDTDIENTSSHLGSAFENGNAIDDQQTTEVAIESSADIEQLVTILKDPYGDDRLRQEAAAALVKSGKEVLEVVGAILEAESLEHHNFKQLLLQELANLDSVEAALALARAWVEDQMFYGDQDQVSENVRYAIAKAIRKVSDRQTMGNLLTEWYLAPTTTELEAEQLMYIAHPVMISNLAVHAYEMRDMDMAADLMDRLAKLYDTRTTSTVIQLAEKDFIPLDDLVYFMETRAANNFDCRPDLLVEYLTNPEYSPRQRAFAAYALAAAADSSMEEHALAKVYDHEEDPILREHIRAALDLLETGVVHGSLTF